MAEQATKAARLAKLPKEARKAAKKADVDREARRADKKKRKFESRTTGKAKADLLGRKPKPGRKGFETGTSRDKKRPRK
jgi:hypothetical protein